MEPNVKSEATTKAKDRTIDVVVDVAQLFFIANPTEQQVDEYTALIDDAGFGSPMRSPSKDYEVEVYRGKKVTWSIRKSDPHAFFILSLMAVYQDPKAGTLYFNENPLTQGRDGTISGTVMNLPDIPEPDDVYTIKFRITNPIDNTYRDCTIDPKLKLNPER